MRVNQTHNQTPQFSVLSQDEREMIFRGALEVMERVGGRFYHPEAIELFKNSDAQVVDDSLVKIPSWLTLQALKEAPSKVTLCTREGKRVLDLGRDYVYFGTGSDCPFIYDQETGERRRYTRNDVYQAAKVVDYLPNLDFFMSLGLASDVPHDETYDRHQFFSMVQGTNKPLVITAVDGEGLDDIYRMTLEFVGDEDELRLNPRFAVYIEPSSPLAHSKEVVEKLLLCAERSIPCIYTPCPSAGATAPASLAGMLVQTLAESLQGLVLSYLKKPGMPFVMGGVVTIMDMKTSNYCYGAPEMSLASAALTDVSKYLNVPMFSTAGCTDARIVDEQAALEAQISIETAFLSGASLVHDIGYLDSGLNGSLEMLVLCDEIIGMVKHLGKGITVDQEHLAPDLIDEVGPGGNFLTHAHTQKHYRKEFYFPTLLDRYNIEVWNARGKKTISDHVNEKLDNILETHQPAELPQDVKEKMQKIIDEADAKAEETKSNKKG